MMLRWIELVREIKKLLESDLALRRLSDGSSRRYQHETRFE